MSRKVWGEITYPYPNFNGSTVEVSEWISNFTHTLKWVWAQEYYDHGNRSIKYARTFILVSVAGQFSIQSTRLAGKIQRRVHIVDNFCDALDLAKAYYL